MAMKRFPCEVFASIELNQVEFPWQGMVVSQKPLSEDFTKEAPCENGMWVDADKSNDEIRPISEDTDVVGVVYTTEKEYDHHYTVQGLKYFSKVAGEYPRVGIFSKGDTITSNCFQYDDGEFADEEALFAACADFKANPLYVVPVAGSAVPQLTATKPDAGCFGKVCKDYTMPNGEHGLKYNIVRV